MVMVAETAARLQFAGRPKAVGFSHQGDGLTDEAQRLVQTDSRLSLSGIACPIPAIHVQSVGRKRSNYFNGGSTRHRPFAGRRPLLSKREDLRRFEHRLAPQ